MTTRTKAATLDRNPAATKHLGALAEDILAEGVGFVLFAD